MGPEAWLLLTLMMPADKPDIHYREKMPLEQCWKDARDFVDAAITEHEQEMGVVGHGAMCAKMGNKEEGS